ncbi:MAG: GreA/GreB family elongation factor [Polyangia bacterium]
MSKAFTKDEGAASEPVLVPPRAPLPDGVPNYVTARGLQLLRTELAELDAERTRTEAEPDEEARRRGLAVLQARRAELDARLRSAVLVDLAAQPRSEVRFGAEVTVRTAAGAQRTYAIVGVDEARAGAGSDRNRIAFTAPLARALLGRRVGDLCTVRTPRGEEELEILAVAYAPDLA